MPAQMPNGRPSSAGVAAHSESSVWDHLLLNRQYGDLYFIKRLGVGGMGRVYLVELKMDELKVGKSYALKILNDDSVRSEQQLRQEAECLISVRHRNIVEIHRYGLLPVSMSLSSQDGPPRVPYLLMDYIPGKTIQELLLDGQRLPLGLTLSVIMQMAKALNHLHQKHNIVHQDIKPANIILATADEAGDMTRGDFAKLLDFGMARLLGRGKDSSIEHTETLRGTPKYMAPEQFMGGAHVGHHTDIYSLAVTWFEMLAGRPPFIAKNGELSQFIFSYYGQLHCREIPPSVASFVSIPKQLSSLIDSMLSKEATARPSIEQVISIIKQIQSDLTTQEVVRKIEENEQRSKPLDSDVTVPPDVPHPSDIDIQSPNALFQLVIKRLPAAVTAALVIAGTIFSIPRLLNWTSKLRDRGIATTSSISSSSMSASSSLPATVPPEPAINNISAPVEPPERLPEPAKVTPPPKVNEILPNKHGDLVAITGKALPAQVAPFWIDKDEVSAWQYGQCVINGPCQARAKRVSDKVTPDCTMPATKAEWKSVIQAEAPHPYWNHPANCVSASNAKVFCAWAGKRLPTKDEWLAAAHGIAGTRLDSSLSLCVNHLSGTCSVGEYTNDLSLFGVRDMGAGVSEWIDYMVDSRNIAFIGGNWHRTSVSDLRVNEIHGLESDVGQSTVGFRCAKSM